MRVLYYWSEDGTGEFGELTEIVTDKEHICDYCNQPVLKGSNAVALKVYGNDAYILHTACAIKSCEVRDSLREFISLDEQPLTSGLDDLDKKRFFDALDQALFTLEKSAHCFCYDRDPAYWDIVHKIKSTMKQLTPVPYTEAELEEALMSRKKIRSLFKQQE